MKELKLNHPCPICCKEILLGEDVVIKSGIWYHLKCFLGGRTPKL